MKIYNLINSISSKQLTPNKNNSKAFCFFSKKIKIKIKKNESFKNTGEKFHQRICPISLVQ